LKKNRKRKKKIRRCKKKKEEEKQKKIEEKQKQTQNKGKKNEEEGRGVLDNRRDQMKNGDLFKKRKGGKTELLRTTTFHKIKEAKKDDNYLTFSCS